MQRRKTTSSQIRELGNQGLHTLRQWPDDDTEYEVTDLSEDMEEIIPSATTPSDEKLQSSEDTDLGDSIIPNTSSSSSPGNENIPIKYMMARRVSPRTKTRTSQKECVHTRSGNKRKRATITEYFKRKKDDKVQSSDEQTIANLVRIRRSKRNKTDEVNTSDTPESPIDQQQKRQRKNKAETQQETSTRNAKKRDVVHKKKGNYGKKKKKEEKIGYRSNLAPMLEMIKSLREWKAITPDLSEKTFWKSV